MEFERGWVMRQIDLMIRFLAGALGLRTRMNREQPAVQAYSTDSLYTRVFALTDEGRLGEAEDLLFAEYADSAEDRTAVIAFYERLNAMSDEQLIEADFPRKEIADGLRTWMQKYGLADEDTLYV